MNIINTYVFKIITIRIFVSSYNSDPTLSLRVIFKKCECCNTNDKKGSRGN